MIFLALGSSFLYAFLIGISSITLTLDTVVAFILVSIPVLGGFYFLSIFLRSRKIEFHDEFLRVFQNQDDGTKSKDIKYFRIDVGNPVQSMNAFARAITGRHFKITDRGGFKKPSWNVRDDRIEELNTSLYFWLLYKTGNRDSYEI